MHFHRLFLRNDFLPIEAHVKFWIPREPVSDIPNLFSSTNLNLHVLWFVPHGTAIICCIFIKRFVYNLLKFSFAPPPPLPSWPLPVEINLIYINLTLHTPRIITAKLDPKWLNRSPQEACNGKIFYDREQMFCKNSNRLLPDVLKKNFIILLVSFHMSIIFSLCSKFWSHP